MTNAEMQGELKKLRARCVQQNDQINQLTQENDSLQHALNMERWGTEHPDGIGMTINDRLTEKLANAQEEILRLNGADEFEPAAVAPSSLPDIAVCYVPRQFCDDTFRLFENANKFVPFYGMAMVKEDVLEIHKDNPLMLRRR